MEGRRQAQACYPLTLFKETIMQPATGEIILNLFVKPSDNIMICKFLASSKKGEGINHNETYSLSKDGARHLFMDIENNCEGYSDFESHFDRYKGNIYCDNARLSIKCYTENVTPQTIKFMYVEEIIKIEDHLGITLLNPSEPAYCQIF